MAVQISGPTRRCARFLIPCTKSGVFLREITSRLIQGLEKDIPVLEKRVDHILTNQVFGIGITHLTSLLARRSVYCSKHANGEHSIAKGFSSDDGNVWFQRIKYNGPVIGANFVGQHGPFLIELRILSLTPMRSFTPTASSRDWPRY